MEEENKEILRRYAVRMTGNFNENNEIVATFESLGGVWKLPLEILESQNEEPQYLALSDGQIVVMSRDVADSRKCIRVSHKKFLLDFMDFKSAETSAEKETSSAKKEDDIFKVCLFGERDQRKADSIQRVFEKHGCECGNFAFEDTKGVFHANKGTGVHYVQEKEIRSYVEKGIIPITLDLWICNHPEDKDCLEEPKKEKTEEEIKAEREEAFKKLSASIMEFLNQPFCHPHMYIIANWTGVQLVEGLQCENPKEENQ